MSDLCYNCGDCHLPRPCAVNLKYCEICTNFGHTYNFCPLSVRRKDPGYMFWALCHNCDKWHLPDPCQFELHTCAQCGHRGHKEFFCPVKSLSRNIFVAGQNEVAGVKRQRTNGSDISEGVQPMTAEVVQKIKTEVVNNVMNLINKGFDHEQVVRFLTSQAHLSDIASGSGTFTQNGSMPNTPTPTPAHLKGYSTQSGVTPGLYSIMHDRYHGHRGDLGNNQTQGLSQSYRSPYADSFYAAGGNGQQKTDDNINVGTASVLQELAQSAVADAVTSVANTGAMVSTAGGNIIGPASRTQNFGEHLANTIDTTVADYKAVDPALADAPPTQGFAAVNTTAPENMPPYHAHTLPPQTTGESITVGTLQPEDPPLLLRKDGKPYKKQPKRAASTKKT